MKTVFVEQIRERDWVESPFLVRDKIMAMAKNGKPYMTLKLMDRSGEVEGRVWDRVDELSAQFEKDDFIRVQGKASVYMGKMQLVIQQLARLGEEEVELGDYLPISRRQIPEMIAELRSIVEGMDSSHLKGLMESFLADESFLRQYSTAPAAKAMHHVCLGGLLEHSLAVAALAEDVSQRYPTIDRDLLLTGALLHDVGKVAELRYRRSFDYTDAGKLLGHIVIGVEMVTERIRQLPDFPEHLAVLVKHLLLSHHGQYEFGSPKRPKMLEAVILNFVDDLDSKINGVQTHIDKEPDSASDWTAYHRLYDRYFFKHKKDAAIPGERQTAAEPAPRPSTEKTSPVPDRIQEKESGRGDPQKEREAPRRKGFGFTLGDQLQGKSLDLFSTPEEDE